MANNIDPYNPIFYAQEALIALENQLGMAGRVHRGFDEERKTFGKGDKIQIRRPSTFTAMNSPSVAQDLNTSKLTMTLDQHKEVRFEVSDAQLSATGDSIITEHVQPAAYALAQDIDQALNGLALKVGNTHVLGANPFDVAAILAARKVLFNQRAPMQDGNMHFEVDGAAEAELLALSAFSQDQGSGSLGVSTQVTGNIGTRYSTQFFANQNVAAYTSGTDNDLTLAINGTFAIGVSTINLDAGGAGSLVPGDQLSIAGDSQVYAVTNTTSASGGAWTGVEISPPLRVAPADNTVVTVGQGSGASTAQNQNLLFHRNAFALAMAKLPMFEDMGGDRVGRYASVQSEDGQLSIRARLWNDPNDGKFKVGLDTLYAVEVLDSRLACRVLTNV